MSKDIIFQVPAEVTGVSTMSKGAMKIIVQTQENIDAESKKRLMEMHEQLGWFCFVVRKDNKMIEAADLIDLPPLDINQFDIKKSPQERLRNIMFIYYTSKGGEKSGFDIWYVKEVERKIQQYKDQIPPDFKL